MNLTHDVVVIVADPPLVHQLPVPKQMWGIHVLRLEPVEEGNDEDIDAPLSRYLRKMSKKQKKK